MKNSHILSLDQELNQAKSNLTQGTSCLVARFHKTEMESENRIMGLSAIRVLKAKEVSHHGKHRMMGSCE